MNIIKSVNAIPIVTEEDIKNKEGTLYWPKPKHFIKTILIEDENKNQLKYKELDEEVEVYVKELGPITIFYESDDDSILTMLKSICNGEM